MKVHTPKGTVSYDKTEDVMRYIDTLIAEASYDHQLIVVEKDEDSYIEVGIGMEDQSVVIYVPEDPTEEMKITCNEFVDRAKTEDLVMQGLDDEASTLTIANIILLEEAKAIIEAYLDGENFLNIADWYTY